MDLIDTLRVTEQRNVQDQAKETMIMVCETNNTNYIRNIASFIRDQTHDIFYLNQFLFQRVYEIEIEQKYKPNDEKPCIDLMPIFTAIYETNEITLQYKKLRNYDENH